MQVHQLQCAHPAARHKSRSQVGSHHSIKKPIYRPSAGALCEHEKSLKHPIRILLQNLVQEVEKDYKTDILLSSTVFASRNPPITVSTSSKTPTNTPLTSNVSPSYRMTLSTSRFYSLLNRVQPNLFLSIPDELIDEESCLLL
uniref:Uncharacterized protein n=1 Tax=Panagrellus redivivus TaxID=6233 RepID=A0A7E4V3U1_PANRE